MEIRNAVYVNNAMTAIDVEYAHPTYGWIPFTATATSTEPLVQEIYTLAIAGTVAPYIVDPVAEALRLREAAKAQRTAQVEQIKVTTQAGNVFDGDEVSQGRMARAIIALQATGTPTTLWVLADNSVIQATAVELTEAMVLAGMAQAAIWVI